jgi:SAM-dependent methyltransferase
MSKVLLEALDPNLDTAYHQGKGSNPEITVVVVHSHGKSRWFFNRPEGAGRDGMINQWRAKRRPVAGGFDPIDRDYALKYAQGEWSSFSPALIDLIEDKIGGLSGKRVLDLGAGPGQYAVEFAKRGAQVTWHDISRNYESIAQAQAAAHGLEMAFSLGYLEEADRLLGAPFDLVFNRICWFYCMNDKKFARLVHNLIRPGGWGFIENFMNPPHGVRRMRYWLNAWTGIKVGYPPPPPGRLKRLFEHFPDLAVEMSVVSSHNERYFLAKR